jgi:class 3 adenylate cyclase/CHASE2 domain-containing sensor protein
MNTRHGVPALLTAVAAAAVTWHGLLVSLLMRVMPPGLSEILLRAAEVLLLGTAAFLLARPLVNLVRALLVRWDAFVEKRLGGLSPFVFRLGGSLILCLGVACVMTFASERTQAFASLERRVLDGWFGVMFPDQTQVDAALHGKDQRVRDDITIVTVDNESVRRLGWPMPRHLYASFIDAMTEAGARSVMFDVLLVDANRDHPEWDARVGEAAARNGHVVFGYPVGARATHAGPDRAALLEALRSSGSFPASRLKGALADFSDVEGMPVEPDPVIGAIAPHARTAFTNIKMDTGDEVLRHGLLFMRLGDRVFPSLALQGALTGLGLALDGVEAELPGTLRLGGTGRLVLDEQGRTLLRYQGRPHSFREVPLHRVVQREVSFTLPGNPLGDLKLALFADTRVTVDGKPVSAQALDTRLLKPGRRVKGTASTTTDPARLVELALFSGEAPSEPAYEMVDESTLGFDDGVDKVTTPLLDPSAFRGKHVFLGSTASAAADIRLTPVGAMGGVEHHATLLNNLLSADGLVESPGWLNVLLILLLALFTALVVAGLSPAAGALASALLLLLLVAGAYTAFNAGTVVPLVGGAGTVALGYVLSVLHVLRREQLDRGRAEEGREFIRRTFGRYLTDQVVDTLLNSSEGLKLGGDRRKVTIMMTDLRGFTSMSTQLEPEQVVAILNNYLAIMTDIVIRYGGTIDEFIGDAILVVFGAPVQRPDDAVRGVACAIEMLNAMEQANAWNLQNGLPAVDMGIGMNTGECVVGNIGGVKRAKYGIVGTPINMCARVEGFTVGGQLMVSDSVRQECGDALNIRDTMSVMAKGIATPIVIHDVIGVKEPHRVSLPVAPEDLRPLGVRFPLRFNILVGKSSSDETCETEVVALSDQGMVVKCPRVMEALTNLKFWIYGSDGALLEGDLYGKVTRPVVDKGTCYVRFTSIPDVLKAEMNARWQAARLEEDTSVAAPLATSH